MSHTSLFIPSCGDQAISIFTVACRLYQRSEPFADLSFPFLTANCVVARWPTAESSISSCNHATGVTSNTSVPRTSLFTCTCFNQITFFLYKRHSISSLPKCSCFSSACHSELCRSKTEHMKTMHPTIFWKLKRERDRERRRAKREAQMALVKPMIEIPPGILHTAALYFRFCVRTRVVCFQEEKRVYAVVWYYRS